MVGMRDTWVPEDNAWMAVDEHGCKRREMTRTACREACPPVPGGSCHLGLPRPSWPSVPLVEWLLLTTAVMVTAAPGVGDLGAVGEDAPAVADAAMALERHVIAVLVALGFEPARVDIRDVAGLFQALAQY